MTATRTTASHEGGTLSWRDPETGIPGWLVYDGLDAPLAAGGCRATPGLSAAELAELARRMTLKQRILRANVDGAKAGVALPANVRDRNAVLGRFLTRLAPELATRMSLGPDVGTAWDQLRGLASAVGVPSPKAAVRRAQRMGRAEFARRLAMLEEPLGPLTLGGRRAGHALAHAVLGAAAAAGGRAAGRGPVTVALQGFGTLGRAAALSLWEAGARVVAVADEYGCLADPAGLPVPGLLLAPPSMPVPGLAAGPAGSGAQARALARPGSPPGTPGRVFGTPADVLVLAACADALSAGLAGRLDAAAVVVGANCGLSDEAERVLSARGTVVVPDVVGGIGGSASMEALFGPPVVEGPQQVLDDLTHLMRELVADLVGRCRSGRRPHEAVADIAEAARVDPDAPAYGRCPYLPVHRRRSA